MRFRTRSANEIAADALRMAERKEAQGCSPCAETYRELARDPSRRRLIGRALLGAGGLATASLVDVGGVLAGSSPAVNGDSGAAELPELDAARLGSRLGDHSAVAPLARFLEQRGQHRSGYQALAVTHNGQLAGTALIQRHGADAFVLVGRATDGTVVPGGAVHGTQAFVLRGSSVVLDPSTTERLEALAQAAPLNAHQLRAMLGPKVAEAGNCPPNTCYVLAAGCGFFAGCCFTSVAPCCPFGAGFCAQLLVCCFG